MHLYLDESGDLGWSFDKPFRRGGSSRYITIASALTSKDNVKHLGRLVKDVYTRKNHPPKQELKAIALNNEDRKFIAAKVRGLVERGLVSIFAITADKRKVHRKFHHDGNILYNHLIMLSLYEEIKQYDLVQMYPDARSIRMKYVNTLDDYIKLKLLGEEHYDTDVEYYPTESHDNKNVQFADYIANIIWRRYENREQEAYAILYPAIQCDFFPKERHPDRTCPLEIRI